MWLFRKQPSAVDEDLVSNYFSSGDKRIIGQLFEKHVETVYGACLFYFRNAEEARDAVMFIFEKLIVELRKTHVVHFKAWLALVVRNHCISELRKQKRHLPETYLDFEIEIGSPAEENKIASVSDDEMLTLMQEMLPALKENQRTCIELFYLREMSYREISDLTLFSINEVKSFIQNGKRNLKIKMEEKIKNQQDAA